MSISQILVWMAVGSQPPSPPKNGTKKASDSGERLAVALQQFNDSQDRHEKVSAALIGTMEEVRQQSAEAATLAIATLECECPAQKEKTQ